jgi:hypothetical protein
MGELTGVRLGRKAIKTDTRTLRLARYLTAELPPPPPTRDWSKGIAAWGMLANDTLGDCTCAGVGHACQVWTANVSSEAVITNEEVLGIYEQWCGYEPSNPATDQGGVELDVLTAWRNQGFAGHKILAFATVLPANQKHVQTAINLFGGLYTGVALPLSAQEQVGGVWDAVADDADGLTCITWGALQRISWAFWSKYFDEAYALISPDFVNIQGQTPNGFALADLEADVAQIN